MLAPDILTPAENTTEIDTNEFEKVDREHGTIYYEREQMHEVPPLPNALPEIVHPDKQSDMTDVQHGIISYEQEQKYEVPPMPEPLRDTVHTNNTEQAESESLPEEMNLPINNDVRPTTSSPETPEPITRNNITRYSLREAPVPKTYNNFLVHKLHAKPALVKFMQRKSTEFRLDSVKIYFSCN